MAMIAIADGQPTNKVAVHWAHRLANRKARHYAFLDLGATSGAAPEGDEQDLDNTSKMLRKSFTFPDGCTGKATKKMVLRHNLRIAAQKMNIVPGLQLALVRVPKLADAGYTTVLKKMARQSMMAILQPSQQATHPSLNPIGANTLACGD
jgi:hypothetical protein